MANTSKKFVQLERRKKRIRRKLHGTPERPRLRVNRTVSHIYAQIIDDTAGRVLAAVSSLGLKIPGGNVAAAKQVGKALGEAAASKGIEQVSFDRGGRLFHGRIKALAEAAREAGLKF
jgi:large subunit ribosomal protein L18